MKLLIIADDFTGALDTAAQLCKGGTYARVIPRFSINLQIGEEVLVIDAETRHLSPDDAAFAIEEIGAWAREQKTELIYKKTDSALRGNIGSELTALLRATGEDHLYFVPAFPKIGRVTSGGVHTIRGVPVSETVFGKDPFDPVRTSRLKELVQEQTYAEVTVVPEGAFPQGRRTHPRPCVYIFDATTDDTLRWIAQKTAKEGKTRLLAGCAGFAEYLRELALLPRGGKPWIAPRKKTLVVSGSLNPITLGQVAAAEAKGCFCRRVRQAGKGGEGRLESLEGKQLLAEVRKAFEKTEIAVLQAEAPEEKGTWQKEEGIRRAFQRSLGKTVSELLLHIPEVNCVLIGGDTLMGAMEQMECRWMIPLEEIEPGVVFCRAETMMGPIPVVSKSGGLGNRETLFAIHSFLMDRKNHMDEKNCVTAE